MLRNRLISIFKESWLPLLILYATTLVQFHSLLSFSIYSFGDYYFNFSSTIKEWSSADIWISQYGIGDINTLLWRYPINFIHSIFGYFGFDTNISDKYLVFWPIILFQPLFSYFFVKYFLKSKLFAFIGAVIFSFNTYFLSIITQGHLLLVLPFILSLPLLLLVHSSIENKNTNFLLLSSIFLSFIGYIDLRVLYVDLFYLITLIVYSFIVDPKTLLNEKIVYIFKYIFFLVVPIVLLNLFWLLPFIKITNTSSSIDILRRDLFGSGYYKTINALYAFYPFWNWSEPIWFKTFPVPFFLVVIPIIGVIGIIFSQKNNKVFFFSILLIVGLMFSKQESYPFSKFYKFFFDYFPGFSAFREASKFYYFIIVSYSILIPFFFKTVFTKFKINPSIAKLLYIVILSILVLQYSNTVPFIKSTLGILKTRNIDIDYIAFNSYINRQKVYFRILSVPYASVYISPSNNHPLVDYISLLSSLNVYKSDSSTKDLITIGSSYLSSTHFSKVLNDYSIKYVVVPIKDVRNDTNSFSKSDFNNNAFIGILKKNIHLRQVNGKFSKLYVFENPNFKPKFIASDNLSTLEYPLLYKTLNPSLYKLELNTKGKTLNIKFSDLYNPDWKIYLNQPSLINIALNNSIQINSIEHYATDVKTNYFQLNLSKIRNQINNVNIDNKNMEIYLYFKPHTYFIIGLYASLFSFCIMIIYLSKYLIQIIKNG